MKYRLLFPSVFLALVFVFGALPAAAQNRAAADSAVKQQMKEFERFADSSLREMFGDRPFVILQEPKSAYLPGYGIIVHAELNLYPMRWLNPFGSPTYSQEELKTERDQKVARARQLSVRLRELLVEEAPRLAKLGGDEHVAMVIHFFNQRQYPDVPNQVVIAGLVPELAALEGRKPPAAELDKLVSLREF